MFEERKEVRDSALSRWARKSHVLCPSRSVPSAAALPPGHSVQQARRQQARAADARLPHAPPPLPPRHPAHHHQLGTPGASENTQALEPELPAARASPPALSCPLLQGGEVPWPLKQPDAGEHALGPECAGLVPLYAAKCTLTPRELRRGLPWFFGYLLCCWEACGNPVWEGDVQMCRAPPVCAMHRGAFTVLAGGMCRWGPGAGKALSPGDFPFPCVRPSLGVCMLSAASDNPSSRLGILSRSPAFCHPEAVWDEENIYQYKWKNT